MTDSYRRVPVWAVMAAGLLLAGVAMVGVGWLSSSPPAKPPTVGIAGATTLPAIAGSPVPSGASEDATWRTPKKAPAPAVTATPSPSVGPAGPPAAPLAFSVPVRVSVPVIGVNATVISLGENPNGTVQVPSLTTPQLTSWFDDGPARGQTGPAAIFGHVDTAATGPAVFYRLGDLVPGDTIDVTRADHSVARFVVYRIAEYAKDTFPTMTVYGDTPGPELRLITCGGAFDAAAGSYLDNIVVYARLKLLDGNGRARWDSREPPEILVVQPDAPVRDPRAAGPDRAVLAERPVNADDGVARPVPVSDRGGVGRRHHDERAVPRVGLRRLLVEGDEELAGRRRVAHGPHPRRGRHDQVTALIEQ
jgi:hypothetical protein